MREDFKNAYRALSVNDKRNELNNEMELAFNLIKTVKNKLGIPIDENDSIRNYHIVNDESLTESEMLDLIYFDFYTLQKNIMDLADRIVFQDNQ